MINDTKYFVLLKYTLAISVVEAVFVFIPCVELNKNRMVVSHCLHSLHVKN